jgi:hypothetical protein
MSRYTNSISIIDQQIQLEQFLNIIGTELREQASCLNINNEQRQEQDQTDIQCETKEVHLIA